VSETGRRALDWVVKPALCVDLDGTVRFNKDDPEGFINRAEEVAVYPDVEAVLWKWRDRGYLIFGVSNQGGVAYGFKTPAIVQGELARTFELFRRNPFHAVRQSFHCPEGTVEPYRYRSLCRKPDVGMLALLESEAFDAGYVVDWDRSIVVGDREEDRELANRAGTDFLWADNFFGRTPPARGGQG
jgi:HAD superfamily hydrolase (TIGR01662 family)